MAKPSIVLDRETTLKCPVGKNKANPMWPANRAVWSAWQYVQNIGISSHVITHKVPEKERVKGLGLSDALWEMVIGHNIKFDVCYANRDCPYLVMPSLWDTQLAAYLLSGQTHKYPALNDLIKARGGEVKDDRLAEYWDKGVCTSEIPDDIVKPYLRNDVNETGIEFGLQWEATKEHRAFYLTQMDALRATTAMNLHGMAIDWHYVQKQKAYHAMAIIAALLELPASLQRGDVWASPKELSLFFFGGERKYQEREQVGFYKNGKPKFKLMDKVEVILPKYASPEPLGKGGYYPVDDAVLDYLTEKGSKVAEVIKKIRLYSKIANTYYQGLLDARMPNDRIYPQLNHVSTSTGRLSCTAPNLQNQTEVGDVKRAFISRFGSDGCIVELDYSQLEMVWLAFIADDKQLIDDINSGRDMHEELFKDMYGRKPTKAERKAFKPRTFSLVYGAGATGIATQGKISIAEARKFINTFYSRYKGVKAFHDSILEEANAKREVFYEEGTAGPRYKYTKVMPWGRRYTFKSYLNERTKEQTFSPTELKNYLVQGSATGDMVPMMVGILQRELEKTEAYAQEKACLIMTVHDSVVLDVHKDQVYNVASLAKQVLEDAPRYLKEKLNIDFPCRLSVGVEVGENWQDKEEYDL